MYQEVWQQRYSEPGRVWSRTPNRWLIDLANTMRPGSALDLACGEGADAIWLALNGWQVTAVDFAPAAIERAAATAAEAGVGDRMTWVSADVDSWEPGRTFDLVSVQFLHSPAECRRRIHRKAWQATARALIVVGHDPRNEAEGHCGPSDPALLYDAADVLASLGLSESSPEVKVAECRVRSPGDPEQIAFDSVVVVRRL
ncbi:MAG: methyltransferase domain-containing protein [Candidatus Nanopelagicales bacterium]|nr:methyltransferase domain-containing protein [Candidatus Nanopelagicales bacterium]MDZ4249296.1 methyltransferase domain-containing protein [Candidatus Nanopelagicales bacterium]